jgi:zinc transporter, ZIP family
MGLLGLVFYESRYMKRPIQQRPGGAEGGESRIVAGGGDHHQHQQQLLQETNAYRLAMMIAIGIVAHNFSEGLAIGQSYASGAIGLAVLLMIGFGSHNTTEGFGIVGPLTGILNKPKIRFLILVGLIGGGPTFLGTMVGSL